jgi:phosphodiesterase/alkaline phosphatase D-like protein
MSPPTLWRRDRSCSKRFVPCAEAVPNGDTQATVRSQTITGLQPDTTYYYRLAASNEQSSKRYTNTEGPKDQGQFTTPGPGDVHASVSAVTSESATFDATIDPKGVSATYYVKYGTISQYGKEVPVPPGASLGEGEVAVNAEQSVQGLLPSTVYHYRVIEVREPEQREAPPQASEPGR